MFSVLLVIHLIITLALVGIILLQKSEGGLGSVSGSGNAGAFAPRAQADILTRTTGWLAFFFICTSLALVIMASSEKRDAGILDQLATTPPAAEAPIAPVEPAAPVVPAVPLSQ